MFLSAFITLLGLISPAVIACVADQNGSEPYFDRVKFSVNWFGGKDIHIPFSVVSFTVAPFFFIFHPFLGGFCIGSSLISTTRPRWEIIAAHCTQLTTTVAAYAPERMLCLLDAKASENTDTLFPKGCTLSNNDNNNIAE